MLSPDDRQAVQQQVYEELAGIEYRISHFAGSFEYLCLVDGHPVFTHQPYGPVIRRITH
jgi:hypothetical protein